MLKKRLEGVGTSEVGGLRGLSQGLGQVAGSTENYKPLLETRESDPNAQHTICKQPRGQTVSAEGSSREEI